MEVVLVVVKIGLRLCRESWQIVILRVFCVAGKAFFFFQCVFDYKLILCFSFFLFINRHATGGSIPNLLPKLSNSELNVTQSINNTGNVSGFVDIHYPLLCANRLFILLRCLRNFPIWTSIQLVEEESIQFKYV